jgi:hypothetical protein
MELFAEFAPPALVSVLRSAVENGHVGQAPDPLPEMKFQQRSAGQIHHRRVRVGELARAVEFVAASPQRDPGQVPVVADRGAGGAQFGQQPGEELLEQPGAADRENVKVPALRHTVALPDVTVEVIALDERHGFIEPRKHPRGEQAGHPRPADNGVVAEPVTGFCHPDPFSDSASRRCRRSRTSSAV